MTTISIISGNLKSASFPVPIPVEPSTNNISDGIRTFSLNDGKSETSISESLEFDKRISRLPRVYKEMIGEISSSDYIREIANAISSNSALAVGDASVKHSCGAHAYIIESKPAKYHIHE